MKEGKFLSKYYKENDIKGKKVISHLEVTVHYQLSKQAEVTHSILMGKKTRTCN